MRNRRFGAMLVLALVLTACLAGCAKYQARSAFEQAEELVKAEKFDLAVEKYFEATQDDPGNTTYKIKLLAGRTRAAAFHINKARALAREDKLEEALAEYRLARGFDPSVEVSALEARQLQEVLETRKKIEEGQVRFREKRYAQARKLVNEVLAVDPQNVQANDLKRQLDAKYQAVVMDGIELDMASNEPITLRFKQANVKEVFGILNQLSGINFLLDDEVKDKAVTILLEKATFSQAMELVLQMAGLGKKVLNSKTMIIFPQNKEKEKQYEDQIIQTFYLSTIDAKKAVNLLRTMLQLRKVYVHEERNALVIRDKPETIKLAEQVLKAADRENSEVLFDLEVVAVGNTDALEFGPKLNSTAIKVGFDTGTVNIGDENTLKVIPDSTITKSLSGLTTWYTVPSATFDLAKTLTDTEILASPKIRVRNNEKAKVHIGTREPVITVTTTGDTSTDNIQYVDVGVKLDVEPTIQLDQGVQTKLTLEVSQVIDRITTTNGSVALTIRTTNAQSVLTLKDGVQTIIGGLFESDKSNTKTTIPFIGEIPLLGALISNFNSKDTKREILLSITPYIVKQVEMPEADIATIWSGGEDELMARPKFGAFAQPLLSEVEAITPAAAPSKAMPMRPEPFSAIQGKVSAMPAPMDAATGSADATTPTAVLPAAAAPLMPGGAAAETPAGQAPWPASPATPAAVPPPDVSVPQTPLPAPPPMPEPIPVAPVEPAAQTPLTEAPPIVLPMPAKESARLSIAGAAAATAGQEIALAVRVSGVERLYSAPLFVSYDPALLEFVETSEGTFLGQGGQTTVFSYSPNAAAGQLVIGYKQGVGGQGVSGDGGLFTLKFRAKAAGTARVELNRINFRDPTGTRLAVEPAGTSIVIQ